MKGEKAWQRQERGEMDIKEWFVEVDSISTHSHAQVDGTSPIVIQPDARIVDSIICVVYLQC